MVQEVTGTTAAPGNTFTVPLDAEEPAADWTGESELAITSQIGRVLAGLRDAEQGVQPITDVVDQLWAVTGRIVGKLTGEDYSRGVRPGLEEHDKPQGACEEIEGRLCGIHQALSQEHAQLVSLCEFLAKAEDLLFGTLEPEGAVSEVEITAAPVPVASEGVSAAAFDG